MNNLNFDVRDLRILRDINNYSDFYNRVMNIKNVFSFKRKVIIDVVETLDELAEIINMDVPKWAIGTSFDNVILIVDHNKWKKSNSESVDNLILHEFIHVVLNSKEILLPIWLNEGLAVYFSDQYQSYKKKKLKVGRDFNFYKLDYSSDNVYYISTYIIMELIDEYGVNMVVEEALKTIDFESNKIFNNSNLLRLMQHYYY